MDFPVMCSLGRGTMGLAGFDREILMASLHVQ